MIDPFSFLLLAIATFRISLMLAKEAGPAKCFERCRACLPWWMPNDCIWCWSVWVGALMAALYYLLPVHILQVAVLPFALSGAAVMFNQQFTQDR